MRARMRACMQIGTGCGTGADSSLGAMTVGVRGQTQRVQLARAGRRESAGCRTLELRLGGSGCLRAGCLLTAISFGCGSFCATKLACDSRGLADWCSRRRAAEGVALGRFAQTASRLFRQMRISLLRGQDLLLDLVGGHREFAVPGGSERCSHPPHRKSCTHIFSIIGQRACHVNLLQ